MIHITVGVCAVSTNFLPTYLPTATRLLYWFNQEVNVIMLNMTRSGFINHIIKLMKIYDEYYGNYPVEIDFSKMDIEELEFMYLSFKKMEIFI